MARTIKIAGICGSLRKESFNAKALHAANELAPENVEIDIIRLDDVPLFSQDIEDKGWPETVAELRARVDGADAVLFATPEYNYSVPGVLKNAIDWLSRPEGEAPLNGKPAAIIGASSSRVGTARAQAHLHDIVFYNGMPLLATSEILLFQAADKFDENGKLIDVDSRKFLKEMMQSFVDWIHTIQAA